MPARRPPGPPGPPAAPQPDDAPHHMPSGPPGAGPTNQPLPGPPQGQVHPYQQAPGESMALPVPSIIGGYLM